MGALRMVPLGAKRSIAVGRRRRAISAPNSNSAPGSTEVVTYVYRWDRQGRKGQTCQVTARGTMNSCRVEFSDGFRMVTSRNAIRRNTLLNQVLSP